MRSIIIMKGLPASGKSTYARELVSKKGQYKRISRDNLRDMLDDGKYTSGKEEFVRKAEIVLADLALSAGYTPIIDDCNLSPSAQEMWKSFAGERHLKLEIIDFTHVPLEECIARDKKRQNYVGEDVIRKMYRDFLAPKPVLPVYNPDLLPAILCDLDGTLAFMNGRNPYDASLCENDLVNPAVEHVIRNAGVPVILVSGRSEKHRPHTQRWLAANNIPYMRLFMRQDDDKRKDSIVKEEIYRTHIEGNYNILYVIDDRKQVVQAWRSLGLVCFQVAEGDY